MRILLVGAQGTIGRGVAAELGARHDIVDAGRSRGSVNLDLADTASLHRAFAARPGGRDRIGGRPRRLGPAARDHAGAMGLQRGEQADGQVNLALVGARYLRDGGSITLTSGVLLDQPVRSGAAASLANGGVEAFVRAAAIELPRGLRINAIRPGVVEESMDDYASMCFAASNRCRSHASRWPTAARSRR
jgi:hypothetical protein